MKIRPALKFPLIIFLVIIIVITVSKIFLVNYFAPQEIVEHYPMGQWVELNGAYTDVPEEYTQGYFVRVNNAEKLSVNEYINKYNRQKLEQHIFSDAKNIICISIEFRNDNKNQTEGGISFFNYILIPERKNEYFRWSADLWQYHQAGLQDHPFGFSVRNNLSQIFVVPYTYNERTYRSFSDLPPIEDKKFYLLVSNAPQKKYIDIITS